MMPLTRRALLPSAIGLAAAGGVAMVATSQASAEVPGTTLEPGVHRIAVNTTIKGDLLVKPGATIDVAAGRTLTLLGDMIAPIAPIFTGVGTVDLNRSRVAHAHPEWWGAAPGDATHDSLFALAACVAAHPILHLAAADYYIGTTWHVARPFVRILGAGHRGTAPGQGTRIVLTDGTSDVLRVGPEERPGAVNDFVQGIDIRHLTLTRSAPLATQGNVPSVGLRAHYLLYAHFEQIAAPEHAVGFHARGLVRSTFQDCVAFRSIPGREAGQAWRGFLLDGTSDIGLAGGNASLFLTDCNATVGGDPQVSDAVGLLLIGAFADSFVTAFETAGVATGIRVDGRTAVIGDRARNGHVNLHLVRPVTDQCTVVGIDVRDTSPHAMIDLIDPYVAPAAGAEASLRFTTMRGAATVSGGQLIGTTNSAGGGSATGLSVVGSRGMTVTGLKVLEHARPAVVERTSSLSLAMTILNPAVRSRAAAVQIRDCEGSRVVATIDGADNAFATGVRIDGTATRLSVEMSGVSPRAVGGVNNRILSNGRVLPVPYRDANVSIDGA